MLHQCAIGCRLLIDNDNRSISILETGAPTEAFHIRGPIPIRRESTNVPAPVPPQLDAAASRCERNRCRANGRAFAPAKAEALSFAAPSALRADPCGEERARREC